MPKNSIKKMLKVVKQLQCLHADKKAACSGKTRETDDLFMCVTVTLVYMQQVRFLNHNLNFLSFKYESDLRRCLLVSSEVRAVFFMA